MLFLHIGAGLIGLLSGVAALSFIKGSRLHRIAGNVFFTSMMIMTVAAAYLAVLKVETLNALVGVFTFYLVVTAWMTVKRKAGQTGLFEIAAFLFVLAIAIYAFILGLKARDSQMGLVDGKTAGEYFFLVALAIFFAASDAKMVFQGGVSGIQRIARHLGRMCFALFIATLSLFIGQPQVFPEAVQKIQFLTIPALAAPVIVIAIVMIFWLIRVRFTNW